MNKRVASTLPLTPLKKRAGIILEKAARGILKSATTAGKKAATSFVRSSFEVAKDKAKKSYMANKVLPGWQKRALDFALKGKK